MRTVDSIIDATIGVEGGYVNNPNDTGGPTRWGITQQVARAYGYTGDMKALPRETAVSIYKTRFWQRPGLDAINTRAPALAVELFDIGVNMGPDTAASFLQRTLNVLNRGGSDYADIKVDNDLGPVTLQALDSFIRRRAAAGAQVLLKAVICLRGARYVSLAEGRPADETFEFGWLDQRITFPAPAA